VVLVSGSERAPWVRLLKKDETRAAVFFSFLTPNKKSQWPFDIFSHLDHSNHAVAAVTVTLSTETRSAAFRDRIVPECHEDTKEGQRKLIPACVVVCVCVCVCVWRHRVLSRGGGERLANN